MTSRDHHNYIIHNKQIILQYWLKTLKPNWYFQQNYTTFSAFFIYSCIKVRSLFDGECLEEGGCLITSTWLHFTNLVGHHYSTNCRGTEYRNWMITQLSPTARPCRPANPAEDDWSIDIFILCSVIFVIPSRRLWHIHPFKPELL